MAEGSDRSEYDFCEEMHDSRNCFRQQCYAILRESKKGIPSVEEDSSPNSIDDNNPTVNFNTIHQNPDIIKHNDSILGNVFFIIDQIEDKIRRVAKYDHAVERHLVGSSQDGSRPGKLIEFDFLFVAKLDTSKIVMGQGTASNQYEREVYYDGDEKKAVLENNHFGDCIDKLFLEGHIELPDSMHHAGFASLKYSGIRRMGPASTLLFRWTGDSENKTTENEEMFISIDITLAFPLPESTESKEYYDIVTRKMDAIYKDLPDKIFDIRGKINLVPKPPGEDVWQIDTARLETYILHMLQPTAPVVRVMKTAKLILTGSTNDQSEKSYEQSGSTDGQSEQSYEQSGSTNDQSEQSCEQTGSTNDQSEKSYASGSTNYQSEKSYEQTGSTNDQSEKSYEQTDETVKEMLMFYKSITKPGAIHDLESDEVDNIYADIRKLMRDAHIFLLPEKNSDFHPQFQELTKKLASLRSYALKHIILTEASERPGSFEATEGSMLYEELLDAVLQVPASPSINTVPHIFFDIPIPIISWAVCARNENDRHERAKEVKRSCQGICVRHKQENDKIMEGLKKPDVDIKKLLLHGYQQAVVDCLSERGQPHHPVDINAVIYMPPGSGIDFVALEILKRHLHRPGAKIAIFHHTKAGVWGKWELCLRYLRDYKSVGVHKELNHNHAPLQKLIRMHDILITTPQYYLERTEAGEHQYEVRGMTQFSLVVLDECENVKGKSPCGHLMDLYRKELNKKVEQNSEHTEMKFPTAVGLTTDPGTGKRKSVDMHLWTICAKMTARKIVTVPEQYETEMRHAMEQMEKRKESLGMRKCTRFYDIINNIMSTIERTVEHGDGLPWGPAELAERRPEECYLKFVKENQQSAEGNDLLDSAAKEKIKIGTSHLKLYFEALEIYDGFLTKDAMDHIVNSPDLIVRVHHETNEIFQNLFKVKQKQLQGLADIEYKNQRLSILESKILSLLRGTERKMMVSCKTVEMTVCMLRWMQESETLRGFNPERLSGTRKDLEAGGMSGDKNEVMRKFENGEHRILIITHNAEIQLLKIKARESDIIVNYRHLQNEIIIKQKKSGGFTPVAVTGINAAVKRIQAMPEKQYHSQCESVLQSMMEKQQTGT